MRKIQLAILAVALMLAVQARASLFNITFTSNDGTTLAVASITADPLGGGAFEATGGSIAVSGVLTPFMIGNYGLVPNPNYPTSTGALVSQSGYFIYDDLVQSGQNPFLSNAGLLFQGPGNQTLELNLFSNGPSFPVPNGTYQLYDNRGVNLFGDATISAVPEPTTMVAGALLLLPFGASTIRILRKNRTA